MKDFIKLVQELKKTSRGKAILFFSFYFIFFLIIAILARIFPGNVAVNKDNSAKEDIINISNVNGFNYTYKYDINIDGNNIEIIGKKNGAIEEFTLNSLKYYKSGTLYYLNGIETEVPNNYIEIIDNIDLLLNKASYDSTVSYKSGKEVLRYQISSSTISNIFDNKELDIEEIPNEIRLTKNSNNIDEVELILNSYCIALNKCLKNTNILITYSDFNNIGEITNN